MKKLDVLKLASAAVLALGGVAADAEILSKSVIDQASQALRQTIPQHMGIGVPKVTSVDADSKSKTLTVECNWAYTNVPFTSDDIALLKRKVKAIAGDSYSDYEVKIMIDGADAANYLPEYDKAYARSHAPFVQVQDDGRRYTRGLDGNIVALWQSHGWYFEPKLNRWEWQRARIWQTVEDLYTQSYVLPFLVPMLENAGAYVMSPRERDVNKVEVIVDNDGSLAQGGYAESGKAWQAGKHSGFAYKREQYVAYQNPFFY